MAEYHFRESYWAEVKATIQSLNRRARKLGQPEIVYRVIGTETITLRDRNPFSLIGSIQVDRVIMDISGQAPKINGWAFIGTLAHDHDGQTGGANIFRSVAGESIPEAYRFAVPGCEHCNRVRNRKDTYILQHEDGTTKQVGKSCLKDFLGHTSPEAVAAYAAALSDFFDTTPAEESDYDEDFMGGGGGGECAFPIDNYLHVVAAAVRVDGWRGRKDSDDFHPATADIATNLFLERRESNIKEQYRVTDDDRAQAEAALTWIRTQPESWYHNNEYRTNLYYQCQKEWLRFRELGLTASLIATFKRETEQAREAKLANPNAAHFGTVGKRAAFTLTCTGMTPHEGYYSTTYITRFVDVTGNHAVWFASNRPDFDEGDTITAKATVKEHGEFRNVPQTVLQRVTVQEVITRARDAHADDAA